MKWSDEIKSSKQTTQVNRQNKITYLNLLKEEYKIKIPLSFASYLHSNATEFNEPIFKFFCLLQIINVYLKSILNRKMPKI